LQSFASKMTEHYGEPPFKIALGRTEHRKPIVKFADLTCHWLNGCSPKVVENRGLENPNVPLIH
jgi:hypothetical protein